MSKTAILFCTCLCTVLVAFGMDYPNTGYSLPDPFEMDVAVQISPDTIPLIDRTGDFINNPNNNPFDLKDPAVIEQKVEYDVESGSYIITEKIGEDYYRAPTYMSFQEYLDYEAKQQERNYFNNLAGVSTDDDNISGKIDPIAKLQSEIENSLIDRLFGGTEVDIRPQGNIDLTFGVDFQNVENPILTRRQQRQGGFDFDMDIQMNVEGKIGEKLNLSTNYNTGATFDFENQLNLGYASDAFSEDEIIKNIEAGNVSLPLRGQLIQGSQNLFGLRTDLKFGYLNLSLIAAQQKSQRENIQLEGGSQVQEFEVFADEYDENRHFFLSHYFRDNFEAALQNLPQVNSLTTVTRIQVWVTNDRNATEQVREIASFTDLGEPEETWTVQAPPSPRNTDIFGRGLPANNSNSLEDLLDDEQAHILDNVVNTVQSAPYNFKQTEDFEKVSARLLSRTEYEFDAQLGYVSVNVNLQPDQVLAVAYEYIYNGRVFQVGEFANDVTATKPDSDECTSDPQNVLFLKMLKSSTPRVDMPLWDLMMKNIYNVGAYQVDEQEFRLEVFYQAPGRGDLRFIPEPEISRFPLLRLLNLDNLNILRDPQPDGVFDYVPGITINPRNGRVMFPVLEPFGTGLERTIRERVPNSAAAERIVQAVSYPMLYDSTVILAREFPEFNKFVLKGEYKSAVSSEISLGAFNIPRGSVRVNAGGQVLKEGIDYEVDYNIGRVRILNDAILNSGVPVNVSFEDNTLFGFQTKTLLGVRADYELGENSNIGATFMQLFERPFTQKVNFGDDPINNKVYGLDFNYTKETPWLTKALDALPFYSTKAESSITVSAEVAALKPGHSRAINQAEDEGAVYIDDFEGSASSLDLRTPTTKWVLASVPQDDAFGNNPGFPESALVDNTLSGVNRAHLNWYRIDQAAYRNSPDEDLDHPYTRQVRQTEIFPNLQLQGFDNNIVQSLDLHYDPRRRGAYNFEEQEGSVYSEGLDNNGNLKEPETRWAGIMRDMPNTNFEQNNYEFIEFWMLSPFIENFTNEGDLVFHLGNVSEDILRDSRYFFENGIPVANDRNTIDAGADTCNIDPLAQQVDLTNWSRIPRRRNIVTAFENDPDRRRQQDLGLDGFDDAGEREHFSDYIASIQASDLTPQAKAEILNDPSNDNFVFFNEDSLYQNDVDGIRQRYSRFNGQQGNSESAGDSRNLQASSNQPDSEDLDRNNSLNETESFYEYRIPLGSDGMGGIALNNFVTDSIVSRPNGPAGPETWYRFKIPLNQPTNVVGGISDFRAIRFMRMYMKGFKDPVTLRFARLELVRNQWRRYLRALSTIIDIPTNPPETADFDVNAVNIEENSSRFPFPYVLPAGIVRENSLGPFPNALQNEQSLSMSVCDLPDGDARAIYKRVDMDMRVYDRIKMFVHAEDELGTAEYDPGEVQLFMRLGNDFEENYYEYEIPLTMSNRENLPVSILDDAYVNEVWHPDNAIDFPLDSLQSIKRQRNRQNLPANAAFEVPHIRTDEFSGTEREVGTFRVVGNPNLGFVEGIMIGIRNRRDNGATICSEVWVNELRLSGFDERGGQAGLARIDFQLADLGNATIAGNFSTIGWGQLEEKVNDRARERYTQYDLATNLELSKFLPEKWGLKIPFYAQYSETRYSPEFDPYDLDILLKDKIDDAPVAQKDSIRDQAEDFESIKTINFSRVRKERTNTEKAPMPWDVSNFSASYNHTETVKKNPIIERDESDIYRGGLDYTYSTKGKFIKPFNKLVKNDKYLKFIKEINFNPIPNNFTFNTVLDRHQQATTYRFVEPEFSTFFIRKFTWGRNYDLKWDLMKNLKLNFNAAQESAIDELDIEGNTPFGESYNGTNNDYIKENLSDWGRAKNYYHNINVSYNVPFKNLPFLDWVTLKAQYSATYDWSRSAINADSLGNVIQNSQNRQLNLDLNFEKLYNYSSFLKNINGKKKRGRSGGRTTRAPRDGSKPDAKTKKKKVKEPSAAAKALLRPLMMIRKARVNYSEQFGSVVPGFLPQAGLFGQRDFTAPGWDYVLGFRPNDAWYDQARDDGWITDNVFQNQQVIEDYQQKVDARLTLEPINDFRIEIEASRNYQENHTEFFKDTSIVDNVSRIDHVAERDIGSVTVSYMALQTLFDDDIVGLFRKFEDYRIILSNRLGTGIHESDGVNYTEGFGRYHQDVLIPSFLAAYTDQNPETIDIYEDARNFKNLIPRPNWRVTYNGLSKVGNLGDIFQNVSLTHGYRSTMTINAFNSNFKYVDQNPFSDENINAQTNNYYSRFEIPTVVIREDFSPLIGLDMRLKNGANATLDFKKSRNLSFDLITNELNETKTTEYVVGFGWRLKDVYIGFLQFGPNKKKKKKKGDEQEPTNPDVPNRTGNTRRGSGSASQANDLNFKFDFSFRDDITLKHILDQNITEPTRGLKSIRISPSIDYTINEQLTLRWFVDYNRTIPATSASFPITNVQGGLTVRFTL